MCGLDYPECVNPVIGSAPLNNYSLGTVVAFNLLREMYKQGTSVEVPLPIKMASPLGDDAFRKKLGSPRLKPPFVTEWKSSDFVTLSKSLIKEFSR